MLAASLATFARACSRRASRRSANAFAVRSGSRDTISSISSSDIACWAPGLLVSRAWPSRSADNQPRFPWIN